MDDGGSLLRGGEAERETVLRKGKAGGALVMPVAVGGVQPHGNLSEKPAALVIGDGEIVDGEAQRASLGIA